MITKPQIPYSIHDPFDQSVVNTLVDKKPRPRGTVLPCIRGERANDLCCRELQIGIVEDDARGLPTEFQGERQHSFRSDSTDLLADRHRSGERDFPHQRVLDDRRPDNTPFS
jgi:hypothetical protein